MNTEYRRELKLEACSQKLEAHSSWLAAGFPRALSVQGRCKMSKKLNAYLLIVISTERSYFQLLFEESPFVVFATHLEKKLKSILADR